MGVIMWHVQHVCMCVHHCVHACTLCVALISVTVWLRDCVCMCDLAVCVCVCVCAHLYA